MLDLEKYLDFMQKCSYCEFCQATCPVYMEDLLETHLARARLNLIRAAMVDNTMQVSDRLREVVDRCLMCTNCAQMCPAKIPVDEIVAAARFRLYNGRRQNILRRNLTRKFMDNRGFGSLIGMGQVVAKKMGLLPVEMTDRAAKAFASERSGTYRPDGEIRARVAYYVGCATNSFYPDTAKDVLAVYLRNGIEVMIPEGIVCCGMPALTEGDIETVQVMARTNIEVLSQLDVDAIVTDCTSCGLMLKTKMAKALPEDDPFRLKAELMAAKVWEATDYLASLGLAAEPNALSETFTYHVPCHRGWTNTLNDAPRSILSRVNGAEIVEMEYPERCCGCGGSFYLNYKDLSESVRSHKLEDIINTGAETVLTQCPACRSFLAPALPQHRVIHPISVLAKAYGI